jgi:zinc D-Ala-D-Ala carboxypeptidase
MTISQYISYAEATKSQQAIRLGLDNTPNAEELSNMQYIATTIFDKLRKAMHDKYGKPLAITSFFRNSEVNRAIGGSSSSQHCSGEAIDIDADVFGGATNKEVFDWIKKNCTFDQLIYEYGNDANPDWVHVSLKRSGKNRMQVLRVYKANGQIVYKPYNG